MIGHNRSDESMKTFDPEWGFLYITGPKEDIQALSKQFFSEKDPLEFLTVQEGAFSTLTCSKHGVTWDFDIVKAAEMFPNCEIIKYRGRLFQGVSECVFKLLNSTTLQKEYFNIKMHVGWHALNWCPVTGWFNLLLFGHISYTIVDIVLKNGKKLQYIVDDILLTRDIQELSKCPTNMELLAEMCSASVAERSKAKCKRELLRPRTIKTFENVESVSFTTFYRHKNFTAEHEAFFRDKSVGNFTHTWIEETNQYQLNYTKNMYTHKVHHSVQVVEPSESGLYTTNVYTVMNETDDNKLFNH